MGQEERFNFASHRERNFLTEQSALYQQRPGITMYTNTSLQSRLQQTDVFCGLRHALSGESSLSKMIKMQRTCYCTGTSCVFVQSGGETDKYFPVY